VRAWTSRSISWRRIGRLGLAVGECLGEPGDRLGIDWIVLGQPPGRLGKAANLSRIDDQDLEAGRAQRFRPAPLITTARLHHRASDPVRAQPCTNSAWPSGVLGVIKRTPAERMQASTLFFATSRPTIRVFCAILPLPSLLVRALTPMQLFGLRKTPDLSLASPQVPSVVATGSGPATGGWFQQPPVRRLFHNLRTQGGPKGRMSDCLDCQGLVAGFSGDFGGDFEGSWRVRPRDGGFRSRASASRGRNVGMWLEVRAAAGRQASEPGLRRLRASPGACRPAAPQAQVAEACDVEPLRRRGRAPFAHRGLWR